MIEIMLCKRCHVGNFPGDLSMMLIHPDGFNEPYTVGPYCDGCVAEVREEMSGPEHLPRTIRDVQKLQGSEDA